MDSKDTEALKRKISTESVEEDEERDVATGSGLLKSFLLNF